MNDGGKKARIKKSSQPSCCSCNGVYARCVSCRCVKSGHPCSNCLPARHGNCHNIYVSSAILTPRKSTSLPSTTSSSQNQVFSSLPLQTTSPQGSPQKHPEIPPASQAQTPSTQSRNEPPDTQSLPVITTATVIPSFQCSSCGINLASKKIHKHMQEHAFGKITGDVPSTWLVENSLFICQNCSKLVACSHKNSHSRSCVCNHTVPSSPANSESTFTSPSATPFPSLEEVLALKQGTLKYIPSRARHQFAQVLAEALKDVIHNNNIIAWTRLLMLPKCILASSKRGGKKGRHKISIDTLCQEWSRGNEKSLWTAAVSRACKSHQSTPISQASIAKEFDHVQSDHAKLKSAISCVREGLLSKAC